MDINEIQKCYNIYRDAGGAGGVQTRFLIDNDLDDELAYHLEAGYQESLSEPRSPEYFESVDRCHTKLRSTRSLGR